MRYMVSYTSDDGSEIRLVQSQRDHDQIHIIDIIFHGFSAFPTNVEG